MRESSDGLRLKPRATDHSSRFFDLASRFDRVARSVDASGETKTPRAVSNTEKKHAPPRPIHSTRGWTPLKSAMAPSSATVFLTQCATLLYVSGLVIKRVFTTSSGVVTAPVAAPAIAPNTPASPALNESLPTVSLHAFFNPSYPANSIASNGRSRNKNDQYPTKSPATPCARTIARGPAAPPTPTCRRVFITSVGTRTTLLTNPPNAAAARCSRAPGSRPAARPSATFAGSYAAKNSALAGATPRRFPNTPAYAPRAVSARVPARAAWSRVLSVSSGYNAASTAHPATAPAKACPATSRAASATARSSRPSAAALEGAIARDMDARRQTMSRETMDDDDDDDDDDVRARSTVLLGDALGDDTPLFDAARAVEAAIRARMGGTGRAYRATVRRLWANLRGNESLRRAVRCGAIEAETLVRLGPRELATASRRRADAAMVEKLDAARTRALGSTGGTETDAHKCESCDGFDCVYVVLSDRRDVRKAEIWGGGSGGDACVALIACKTCGHEWRAEMAA